MMTKSLQSNGWQQWLTIGMTTLALLVLAAYMVMMVQETDGQVVMGDLKIMVNHRQFVMLQHVFVAMILGAVLGYDRERADKPAGLRTHMLVAGAAALLVGLGEIMVTRSNAVLPEGIVRSDPLRIIDAVVTAVSFLGAGTIIRHRKGGDIEGLTTAASILFAAALGICVALDQIFLAVGLASLSFVTLRAVAFVANRFELTKHTES